MKKAVALKYQEGFIAPIIMAKGKGRIAEQILTEAKKDEVPISKDCVLVDMLDLENVGNIVPKETFEILAKIFSVILKDDENL